MKCPQCSTEISDDSRFCSKCGTPIHPSEGIQISQTRTILRRMDDLTPGTELAEKYRIAEVVGRGGMGVVYRAEDTQLKRNVALKFLPSELVSEKEARERFVLEAQAAAALSHPNICTIHEINREEDRSFISMEYVEGKSLRAKIEEGPLELEEALDISVQIAEGLEEAHKKGIIHRDIKSANIMVTDKGQAKIMDFGLAKVKGGALLTREGTTLGTVAYMSPEQARGEEVSHRSDIWSLGVVIYQMLCGDLPFKGDHEASILYAVVHEEPKRIKDIKPDIPPEVEQIISRALKKKPESRYSSAAEMLKDLKVYLTSLRAPEVGITDLKSFVRHIRKPRFAVSAILFLLLLCSVAVWFFNRSAKIGWARNEALPEIKRLMKEDNYTAAFKLAQQAEKFISEDPQLIELWPEISGEFSILTTPPEADVYMRDYRAIDSDWEYFGQTPLENIRIPNGLARLKIEKENYRTIERAVKNSEELLNCQLDEEGSLPPEMIRVQGGEFTMRLVRIPFQEPVHLGDFLIDKYEVTNKQFKEFSESGAYRNQKYWNQKFIKDGQILSWEEAMEEFRDATGRQGPATWELGTYPEGQENYPVNGISWYEAAAYAEFSGKSLPTVYHWTKVADLRRASYIVPLSNFGGSGAASVGSYQGMSPYGTYDIAGNVKEWCWNEAEENRYILGGAWNDFSYFFYYPFVLSPFDRSASNGFRCMKVISSEETSGKTFEPLPFPSPRDFSKEEPVSDEIFNVYKDQISYDKTELDDTIESVDNTSPYWIKEKITFNAAYGNERVMVYLFLPKNSASPYQTVIYFPGIGAMRTRSSEKLLFMEKMHFIIKAGRAFLYPVYKSTYERGDGLSLTPTATWTESSFKEHCIQWAKDLQRSIDYLEIRTDINDDKLAYYGLSWGASMGPYFLAPENRIKTGILEAGGFEPDPWPPEVAHINYIPRVKIPILMLNGRYDPFFPLEESARPMLDLLGTPDEHKHLEIFESGHGIDSTNWNKWIKAVLDWLDRYLGPVK